MTKLKVIAFGRAGTSTSTRTFGGVGKYSRFTISRLLQRFEKDARIKITIEEVDKEEFAQGAYDKPIEPKDEIDFHGFNADELVHLVYAVRNKKPLNETDKKIWKILQEIGEKEKQQKSKEKGRF